VGVRKYPGGLPFSTFSATSASALAFLNNTLYGFRASVGQLGRYDSAGNYTTLYTWREVDSAARNLASVSGGMIREYGSKLAVLLRFDVGQSELWVYDGTAPTLAYVLPTGFLACGIEVAQGFVFIYGVEIALNSGSSYKTRPTIYFYANGTPGLLWRADSTIDFTLTSDFTLAGNPACVASDAGLVFNDDTTGRLMVYDSTNGGVHAAGSYTVAGNSPLLAACPTFLLHTRNQTTGYRWPDSSAVPASGYVITSLADFESSLNKNFRGIKVDFTSATDGDGGSVDIAYRVGDVDGSYTTLQTGATSGTEYTLSSVSGQSISVRATINKGTSTSGPVLKRIAVRAAPVQFAFRRETYVLNLSGRDGNGHVLLRDQTPHPKDGLDMATDLRTAATTAAPISITDEFGTFTGIIEADGFQLRRGKRQEYIAVVPVREV